MNSNKEANIKIDGRGNLYLNTYNSEKPIHLSNVIAASNISDNLLSLRKFADAGYGIYMDDEKLNIFNKDTGEEYITGAYQKPNWVIEFNVQRLEKPKENPMKYRVKANLVTLEDFLSQSQTVDSEKMSDSNKPPEIGREEEQEIVETIQIEKEKEINSIDLKSYQEQIKRKIIGLNDLTTESEIKNLMKFNKKNNTENTNKISEGMLWHMRLGHPSLEYMKQMKKSEEKIKNVKLEQDILDCETCILAKMEKLPFKNNRDRSNRPLHTLHRHYGVHYTNIIPRREQIYNRNN